MESTVADRTERANGQLTDVSAADDDRVPEAGQVPDGELLRRFVTQQDEAAFREIVRRYTPLVMGVALRTTHDRQAAEDVLQATFLVLVEKAESLDDPTQIAAWLHGVALRIARRLVDKRHRHREQPHRHERNVMDPAVTTDPFERVCQTRDHDVLGEELQRLPEKLRTPMVLRYLEDLTNEQVAERLGMKVSTVEGRLKRGKKELRRRLARRGVTLGAAMLVWNLTQQSVAAAPVANLADLTATTALAWQSPTPALAPPTDAAISLAQQEMLAMSTLKLTTAGTLVGAFIVAAGLLVAMSGAEEGPALQTAAAGQSLIDTTVTAIPDDIAPPEPPAALAASNDEPTDASIAAVDATEEDGTTDAGVEALDEHHDVEMVTVYLLKSVNPETMVTVFEALFPGASTTGHETGLNVAADADKNRLIVRASPRQHEQIRKLIEAIDDPISTVRAIDGSSRLPGRGRSHEQFTDIDRASAAADASRTPEHARADGSSTQRPRDVKIFQLQHAKAESTLKMLKELLSSADGRNEGDGAVAPPSLSVDASTNSILAYGDPESLQVIEAILLRIDQSPEQKSELSAASPPTRAATEPTEALLNWTDIVRPAGAEREQRRIMAYPVQHVEPEEVAGLLDKLFPGAPSESDPGDPRIAVDRRQRMLIVNGTEQHHEQIQNLIQIIDTPEPQPQQAQQRNALADQQAESESEGEGSSAADRSVQPGAQSRLDITHRSQAAEKIHQSLRSPGFIGGEDRAVYYVLRMLAERHDIPLYFDHVALEEIPLDEIEVPVEVLDAPLASILDLLLRQVPAEEEGSRWQDFNSSGLTYFVEDDVLVITTHEVAEQTMQLRTYDLKPFQVEGRMLDRVAVVEAIRAMTGESTWAEQGGRGTLVEGDHTLIIRNSPLVHREIESLLEQLLHAAEATAEPAK